MTLGQRWTANRKKAVLTQIAEGTLTEEGALNLYGLSMEELLHWRRFGVHATKTPKALYRKPRPRLRPHWRDAADD